jgi:hypothetical protein
MRQQFQLRAPQFFRPRWVTWDREWRSPPRAAGTDPVAEEESSGLPRQAGMPMDGRLR